MTLRFNKIRMLLPEKRKESGSKPYTTDEVRKILEHETNIRNKAIIHFLASTGCRIGALSELRLKHVVDFKEGSRLTLSEITEDFTRYIGRRVKFQEMGYILKRHGIKTHQTNRLTIWKGWSFSTMKDQKGLGAYA